MERFGTPGPAYLNHFVSGQSPRWEVEINKNYFPFLFDHGVQDQTVFAGMGYVESAIALSQHVHGKLSVVLENISFEKVLIVDYSKIQHLVTELNVEDGRFTISSRVEGDEESLLRHCRGRIIPQSEPRVERLNIESLQPECSESVTIDAFYERLQLRGLRYGPAFRPISDIRVGDSCFLLRIDASRSAEEEGPLHPAIFDAALQSVLYCAKGNGLFVPFSFDQFEYYSKPESSGCYAFGRLITQSETLIVADVWLTNAEGQVHAHAKRISCQLIETQAAQRRASILYEPV